MMSRLPELQEADPTLQIVRKWVVEQSVPPRAQVLGKDLISYARIFKELRLDGQNRLVRSYQNCACGAPARVEEEGGHHHEQIVSCQL